MYMNSGRCIALFLFILVQTEGLILGHARCHYKIKHKCHRDVINYNIIDYNRSVINYCTAEDIPHDIDIHYEVKNLTGSLKFKFAPPKRECGLGVALLVNPLIKDERECKEYNFENDIYTKIHTIERSLCILRDTNQLVRYNENSTSVCEDNIGLWFHHIFTGCYALRFRIDRQIYVIRDRNFFYTTYQRTEVTEPQFICQYDTYSIVDQSYTTNFTLDTSLPINAGNSLELMLISPQNKNQARECVWRSEPFIGRWLVHLQVRLMEVLDDRCNIKSMQTVSGEYIKTVQCNFQVQTGQNADYCFIFHVVDNRCHKNTIWNPQEHTHPKYVPCTWVKRCTNTSLHIDHRIETINSEAKLLSANMLLPIIASTLIVLVIGILGFWYLCIRKKKITLYVNPQHDDFLNSACFESTDLSVVDNNDSEKEIDQDNLPCNDIILLYTKNSMSFMTLMKDFRETLAKMCSCSVYDWYEEAEWNDVAKVGPVSWFTKLLDGKCRVVWIDTPITRSIVISRDDSRLNKLDKYNVIGDFRDTAFPVVLELAKHNINDTVHQYRRHFVVRFEGLENTADGNDPFMDLSPHARYRMPQHLEQLCLDLSIDKSIIPKYQMKAEENLLERRLKLVKMESIM